MVLTTVTAISLWRSG